MKICNKIPFLKINIKTIKHVYYAIVLDLENFLNITAKYFV